MPGLYLLSDPHLGKEMAQFGAEWTDHVAKIEARWDATVTAEDVVCVPGDISWAKTFDEALGHLHWLHERPGRHKIIVKGNHDWWWQSTGKVRAVLPPSLVALDGDAAVVDGVIFAGTKGFVAPGDPFFRDGDTKAFLRNLRGVRQALEAAEKLRVEHFSALVVMVLHYPPFTALGTETDFSREIEAAGFVDHCVFGHFHSASEWETCPRGMVRGVNYVLGSCDFLDFTPVRVSDWPSASSLGADAGE